MATDFNKPVVTDAYATLLPGLVTANKDLAMMLEPTLTGTSTNLPTGAVRWNATTIRWERYNGTSWVTLPAAGDNVYAISISGNAATATSATTAAACSGNAATATKLATARTIGGVSFDGSANINLPGVNAPGNQNTTGNAATATTAASCSGNAATATTAAACSGNAATASAANNGYFTAESSYPKLEIHKPNALAGQWAIDSSGNYVFERTNGSGSTLGTLLTLTPSGVLSTSGGYSGNVATATKLLNDTGSAPSYSCRAWVNFNGTGTVSIRASGNVSSITDNGVGDYTVNFATAMVDGNYASASMSSNDAGSGTISINKFLSQLNTSIRVRVSVADVLVDASHNTLAFFR